MCKEFIVEFFSSVNGSIENDNLLDAILMLLLGVLAFGGLMLVVIAMMLTIINRPGILFLLAILFLLCIIYVWWIKKHLKKKNDD